MAINIICYHLECSLRLFSGLEKEAKQFLHGKKTPGLNKQTGYFVVKSVAIASLHTIQSVAFGVFGGITLIQSFVLHRLLPVPGRISHDRWAALLLISAEQISHLAESTLYYTCLVFKKTFQPHLNPKINEFIEQKLNPVMPEILAIGAVVTPLVLASFNYLPKEICCATKFMIVPLFICPLLKVIQKKLYDTSSKLKQDYTFQLESSIINPLCRAAVMRGFQGILIEFVKNLAGPLPVLLGLTISPSGILVGLFLIWINIETKRKEVSLEFIIEQLIMNTFCYGPLFQTQGLLAAAYAEVLFATVKNSVTPIVSSAGEAIYNWFYSGRALIHQRRPL
jgi:hypothetical protein